LKCEFLFVQGHRKWRGSIKGATTVLKLGGPSASRGAEGESRGAEGAEGCGVWEGVSSSPLRRGLGWGYGEFCAFWVVLPHCMLFRATAQESEAEREAMVKDDILH